MHTLQYETERRIYFEASGVTYVAVMKKGIALTTLVARGCFRHVIFDRKGVVRAAHEKAENGDAKNENDLRPPASLVVGV